MCWGWGRSVLVHPMCPSGKISLKRRDMSCTGGDMRKRREESLGHRMPRSSMGRGVAYRSEPGPFRDSGRFHCALSACSGPGHRHMDGVYTESGYHPGRTEAHGQVTAVGLMLQGSFGNPQPPSSRGRWASAQWWDLPRVTQLVTEWEYVCCGGRIDNSRPGPWCSPGTTKAAACWLQIKKKQDRDGIQKFSFMS